MLSEYLKTENTNHSIVEVAFSLFLSNKLINPQSFETLINSEFKDYYHKFKKIIGRDLQIRVIKEKMDLNVKDNQKTHGFAFFKYNEGLEELILKGQNSSHPNKSNISLHNIKSYLGWENFKKEVYHNYKVISKFQPGIFVEAFNLSYVDKFYWTKEEFPNLDHIFNSNSNLIPTECLLNKSPWNFTLKIDLPENNNTDKTSPNNEILFNDLLQILIKKEINENYKFSISISHGVINKFDDDTIENLLDDKQFEQKLEIAHNHNKNLLKKILTPEVQNIIKLK